MENTSGTPVPIDRALVLWRVRAFMLKKKGSTKFIDRWPFVFVCLEMRMLGKPEPETSLETMKNSTATQQSALAMWFKT